MLDQTRTKPINCPVDNFFLRFYFFHVFSGFCHNRATLVRTVAGDNQDWTVVMELLESLGILAMG